MIVRRLIGFAVLAYILGFAAFMLMLPRPVEGQSTDAIVVPTGGPGRIDRGLDLIAKHQAKRMLITGVAPSVRPIELAKTNRAPVAQLVALLFMENALALFESLMSEPWSVPVHLGVSGLYVGTVVVGVWLVRAQAAPDPGASACAASDDAVAREP